MKVKTNNPVTLPSGFSGSNVRKLQESGEWQHFKKKLKTHGTSVWKGQPLSTNEKIPVEDAKNAAPVETKKTDGSVLTERVEEQNQLKVPEPPANWDVGPIEPPVAWDRVNPPKTILLQNLPKHQANDELPPVLIEKYKETFLSMHNIQKLYDDHTLPDTLIVKHIKRLVLSQADREKYKRLLE
ncbi:MAG: hypothetical protein NTX79_04620 [Candidatus Micrarchaeota archaeon]|nr:hypothetical protein [Candidatus Micrarchaeota archaeon]